MAKISNYDLMRCRRPREIYALLKSAGVKLTPYRDGGMFQPLDDWFQYEGRPESLLEKPWTIYQEHSTNSLVIEQ